MRDHAVYCSTKSALDMLSKVMALELGQHKVRIHLFIVYFEIYSYFFFATDPSKLCESDSCAYGNGKAGKIKIKRRYFMIHRMNKISDCRVGQIP